VVLSFILARDCPEHTDFPLIACPFTNAPGGLTSKSLALAAAENEQLLELLELPEKPPPLIIPTEPE
jgi:hypothetical protein